MAKDTSGDKKKRKSRRAIFQKFGKYFLMILILIGQTFFAYTIVAQNYESIYGYVDSLLPQETMEYQLEEIIVNPADTNGQRYLLVQLSLELVNEEVVKDVEEYKSKIRNNLIKYLSSRSVDKLQGSESKEEIRLDLVKIINNAIGSRSVRNLYYSKYVMQ